MKLNAHLNQNDQVENHTDEEEVYRKLITWCSSKGCDCHKVPQLPAGGLVHCVQCVHWGREGLGGMIQKGVEEVKYSLRHHKF